MAHLGGVSVLFFLTLLSSTDSMENCTNNSDLAFSVNLTQISGQRTDKSAGSLEPLYNFARLFFGGSSAKQIPIRTGVILAFATNNKVRENMRPNLHQLQTEIEMADDIFKVIPQNVRAVIDEFSIPKREITKALNETGNVIGETLISTFSSNVHTALSALAISVKDASRGQGNLEEMEIKRKDLQARHVDIQQRLQAIQSQIQSISSSCPTCNVPDASNLETAADYSQISSAQRQLDQLNEISSILATDIVRKGNVSFYSLPQICSNQTERTLTVIVQDLEESEEYLRNCSRRIPTLDSLSYSLSKVRQIIRQYWKYVDYYDYVRWAVAVVFSTLILVIVILMIAALCLGLPLEYSPTLYSSVTKDLFKHTAACLLRSAIVMTFVFSWLFIILVFLTLFVGGNAHSLGCRSWSEGHLFEFFDQSEDLFIPGYNNTSKEMNSSQITNITQAFNSSSVLANTSVLELITTQVIKVKIKTSEMYHGCVKGKSLFYSMRMHEVFNMDEFLNARRYLEVLNKTFQTLSVNLGGFTLLPGSGKQALLKFKNSTLGQIDYAALLNVLSQPVVRADLSAFAKQLDTAAQRQGNESIKEDLEKVANMTRNLTEIVARQELDAKAMTISVKVLREISQQYQDNADRALNITTKTEEAILSQTPYTVGNVSHCVLEKGEYYLLEYLTWVRNVIISEIFDCKWLPVSVDNIYNAACVNIIDPWNAFWLCLGWCCAFLVPGVIFSIHTARHWHWQTGGPKSLSMFTLKNYGPEMTKFDKALWDTEDLNSKYGSDDYAKGKKSEDT